MMSDSKDSTPIVLTLFFILIILILLLFYLYKRLNHETKNKYTIQQLVLGEGGLRDRVIQGVAVVEARLGDRIRSRSHDEEQALSSNEDKNSDKEDEEEGEENAGQGHSENENKTEEKEEEHQNDSSDDYSSIDLRERVKQNNSKEEEKKEVQEEEAVEQDDAKKGDTKQAEDVKSEERVGLLVDLKTFSGSAIWSEEKTEEPNVTAL